MHVCKVAAEWRAEWGKDVVVDLVGSYWGRGCLLWTRSLKVLKSLEFDYTNFEASTSLNFTTYSWKALNFIQPNSWPLMLQSSLEEPWIILDQIQRLDIIECYIVALKSLEFYCIKFEASKSLNFTKQSWKALNFIGPNSRPWNPCILQSSLEKPWILLNQIQGLEILEFYKMVLQSLEFYWTKFKPLKSFNLQRSFE